MKRIGNIYKIIAVLFLNTAMGFLAVTGTLDILLPENTKEGSGVFSTQTGDTFENARKRFFVKNYNRTKVKDPESLIDELIDYLKAGQWQISAAYGLMVNHPYEGKYLSVDKSGFRTTAGSPAKGKLARTETLSVALFGGSTMFGWGLPDENTIPSELQNELAKAYPEKRVICQNLGIPYYNSGNEIELATHYLRGLKKSPDYLIFLDGLNDTNHLLEQRSTSILSRHKHQAYNWFSEHASRSFKVGWLTLNPAFPLFRVKPEHGEGAAQSPISSFDDSLQSAESRSELLNRAFAYTTNNWKLMKSLASIYKIPAFIALQPIAHKYAATDLPLSYLKALQFVAQSPGMLDLSTLFQRVRPNPGGDIVKTADMAEEYPLSFDGSHYTTDATQAIARHLAKAIMRVEQEGASAYMLPLTYDEKQAEGILLDSMSGKKTLIEKISLPARLASTPAEKTSRGWMVHHNEETPQPDQVKLQGNYQSQIYQTFEVPHDTASVSGSLKVQAKSPAATILLDLIFLNRGKEVSRKTESFARSSANPDLTIHFSHPVPNSTDQVMLLVHPWRKNDGIVAVETGLLEWHKESR